MALRDSFGFVCAARAQGADAQYTLFGSLHEQAKVSTNSLLDPSCARGWDSAKLKLPTWGAPQATPTPQLTRQQLAVLKTLIRRGVPFNLRPSVWLVASGGLAKARAAAPGLYAKLSASAATLPAMVVSQMDADVRTVSLSWRQHALLKVPASIQAMSNVLMALLAHNPQLSYTRQLCHMVAFSLVVFGGHEQQEQVFWTLAALLEDKLFSYCQGQVSLGLRVEQEVLGKLAARKLPRLTSHLATMRLSIATFTQPWLSSLYVSCLPPETLARVWDCMMVEGAKPLLRVGLALLKMYEHTLSSCTFPEVLRKVLELRVSRTTDSAALLHLALRGCGSMPGDALAALRTTAMTSLAPGNSSEAAAVGSAGNCGSAPISIPGAEAGPGTGGGGGSPASGSSGGLFAGLLKSASSRALIRTSPTPTGVGGSSNTSSPVSFSGGLGSSATHSSTPSLASSAAADGLDSGAANCVVGSAGTATGVGKALSCIDSCEPGMSSDSAASTPGSTSPARRSPADQVRGMVGGPAAAAAGGSAPTSPSRKGGPKRGTSVGAHLSLMMARLRLGGGSAHSGAAVPAAADEASAGSAVGGLPVTLPRSATTTSIRALAAC